MIYGLSFKIYICLKLKKLSVGYFHSESDCLRASSFYYNTIAMIMNVSNVKS